MKDPKWSEDAAQYGRAILNVEIEEDCDIVLRTDGETFAVLKIHEIVTQSDSERPSNQLVLEGWNMDGTDGEKASIMVYWPAS